MIPSDLPASRTTVAPAAVVLGGALTFLEENDHVEH
jgi:hypothetical protein